MPSNCLVNLKGFARKAMRFLVLSLVSLRRHSSLRRVIRFLLRMLQSSASPFFLSSPVHLNCLCRSCSLCHSCEIFSALWFLVYWPLVLPFSLVQNPSEPSLMIMVATVCSLLVCPPFHGCFQDAVHIIVELAPLTPFGGARPVNPQVVLCNVCWCLEVLATVGWHLAWLPLVSPRLLLL